MLNVFNKLRTCEDDFFRQDSFYLYYWVNQIFVKVNSDN